jgi:hypothetical protein
MVLLILMVLMAPTVLTDGPGGIGDTEGTKIDEPLLVSRVLRGKLISMEFLNPQIYINSSPALLSPVQSVACTLLLSLNIMQSFKGDKTKNIKK